ncbi:MAG: hydroxymethylglutaryl-CoA synthase [Microbacterium sp.]
MKGIGIHDIALATAHHVVSLDDLAAADETDPAKFHVGIGQDEFSFPAPDEDIVTLAADAAAQILERHGTEGIRTVLFATESGIDQSKSAGVFLHSLLGLPAEVRTVELKQACYGGTAALQAALGIISRSPAERVLVIASDVARYALHSSGEPTQGAGAVAMLVSADPAILEIEPTVGVSTVDADDFFRPNDSDVAVVNGKLSISVYTQALNTAWDDLAAHGGPSIDQIARFCYHQPFTKMASKAHRSLGRRLGVELPESSTSQSYAYNRLMGNTYTASLFSGLLALLDDDDALAGQRIGLFSYGSGSVGEFFTGIVQPGYIDQRRPGAVDAQLRSREPIAIPDYRALHAEVRPSDVDYKTPRVTTRPFRFTGVSARARRYEKTPEA